MHDVAIADDIILALKAHFSSILTGTFTSQCNEVAVRNRLGTDKAFFKIGMNDAGGLGGARAFGHGPGAGFLRPDSEIGNQLQELVARTDEALEARLRQARARRDIRHVHHHQVLRVQIRF